MAGELGLGIEAVGFGLEVFGGLEASQSAKKKYETEKYQAQLEMQINQQKRSAMELQNRRSQMEQVRTAQVARSMALTNASSQGAQFSSSLQGGYGSISGAAGTNILGMSQGLQIGESVFNLQDQISAAKIQEAKYASDQASWQGLSSIGSGLMGFGGSKFLGNH